MNHVLVVTAVLLACATPVCGAEPPVHAGYRKTTLEYVAADGAVVKRSVLVWYPTAAAGVRHSYRPQIDLVAVDAEVLAGRHPLILFSHGFLGAADQSIFLTEELARQGYIVAGVNHADGLLEKRDGPMPRPNFGKAETWDDTKYRDRRDDVVALLDQLLAQNADKDAPFYQRIDETQIGALGHSLGGYTVIGLAGGWPAWHEKRLRAVVALSPYGLPFLKSGKGSPESITVPLMLQGGTLDFGITPFLSPLFDKLPGAKYLLTLKGENHFGWTNLASLTTTTTDAIQQGNPQLIADYTVAFFNTHLRCQPAPPLLTQDNDRLHDFRRGP